MSTNSDEENEINGDLNGNDVVKLIQRSPKGHELGRPEQKRMKLEENGSRHKSEVTEGKEEKSKEGMG